MSNKVAYLYDPSIETFNFGPDHPMKPKKVAMTHDILSHTHLLQHMTLYNIPKINK